MSGYATVRRRGLAGLAWATFAIAIATGALAATTGLGQFVYQLVHAAPWPWLPGVLLLAGVVTTVIDVFNDGQPNQAAVYSVLLIPSLAISTDGALARNVTSWSGDVLAFVDPTMSAWLGTTSSTGLAVAGVVGTLLMSKRVVKKGGGKTTGTVPAMTTTTRKVVN